MNLIGKNRIAQYLEQHPEAAVTLMTWIKEFPYVQERISRQLPEPAVGFSGGTAQPDLGEYCIKFVVNHSIHTTLITWIGTKAELMKQVYEENPQEIRKTVEVIVAPPVPFAQRTVLSENQIPKPVVEINIASDYHLAGEQSFASLSEYEQALDRLLLLFKVQPVSAAFEELSALLPSIKKYEANQLNFPEVKIFELIKHRMGMFQLTPQNLAEVAGGEAQMNRFLSGETELPNENLSGIYKILAIKFPVSDRYYLS